jgi:hypothetical protein
MRKPGRNECSKLKIGAERYLLCALALMNVISSTVDEVETVVNDEREMFVVPKQALVR